MKQFRKSIVSYLNEQPLQCGLDITNLAMLSALAGWMARSGLQPEDLLRFPSAESLSALSLMRILERIADYNQKSQQEAEQVHTF